MINRQVHLDVSNQEKIINSSFFKFYYDGIGFNGYSIRLSNFSFNNTSRNLTRFATWSFGIACAMGDVIGFRINNDKNIALRIITTPTHAEAITATILEGKGKCDMDAVAISYTNEKSDHYIHWCRDAGFGQTALHYSVSFPSLYYDYATLCVDTSQEPTQALLKFEYCLYGLVSNTIKTIEDTENTVLSYGVATLGLFGIGYIGHKLYNARQNQVREQNDLANHQNAKIH